MFADCNMGRFWHAVRTEDHVKDARMRISMVFKQSVDPRFMPGGALFDGRPRYTLSLNERLQDVHREPVTGKAEREEEASKWKNKPKRPTKFPPILKT